MVDNLIAGKNNLKGVVELKNESKTNRTPTIAEGIDTEDELKRDATKAEIDSDNYTKVTTLSLDENDPS